MDADAVRALRMRHARETLALLKRQHCPPTREDAIALHELHARHERELGRVDTAERAESRAAYVRDLLSAPVRQ